MPDRWQLEGFGERFDSWADQDDPPPELRTLVLTWLLSRFEDPYQDARREPDIPDLWLVTVPGSRRDGRCVVCTFWILESERLVRSDQFGWLSDPT